MKITTMLRNLVGYFSDGIARIFSLDRNTPPEIGVQPFEGDLPPENPRN